MLILPKVIGACRAGVKGGGNDLGDIGTEAGILVRIRFLLMAMFGGTKAGDEGRVKGGGRVLRTRDLQVTAMRD